MISLPEGIKFRTSFYGILNPSFKSFYPNGISPDIKMNNYEINNLEFLNVN